jgi:hypothetical protein
MMDVGTFPGEASSTYDAPAGLIFELSLAEALNDSLKQFKSGTISKPQALTSFLSILSISPKQSDPQKESGFEAYLAMLETHESSLKHAANRRIGSGPLEQQPSTRSLPDANR